MKRPRRLFVLVVLATALGACGPGASSQEGVPTETAPSPTLSSASPTSGSIATPSPTEPPTEPTADPATVLAADGIGPYDIGASLSDLQVEALVTNIAPSFNCDDAWQSADATGRYAGQLSFTFHLGRLTDIHTASTEVVTPSGARVGMPLTELQGIYGDRARLITGVNGNQALSVREPGTALGTVFYLDEANTTTRSISAGDVQRLEEVAVIGEGC